MKKILTFVMAICMGMSLVACGNVDMLDTTWTFDKAIICLADGTTIEGRVDKWLDFENSDMIQVVINGKTYLTHRSNVVLIAD